MAHDPEDLATARDEDRDLRAALSADDPAPAPQPGDDQLLARAWTRIGAAAAAPSPTAAPTQGSPPPLAAPARDNDNDNDNDQAKPRRRWLVGLGAAACLGLAGMIGFAAVSATFTQGSQTIARDSGGAALSANAATTPGAAVPEGADSGTSGAQVAEPSTPPADTAAGTAQLSRETSAQLSRETSAQLSRDATAVVATDDVMAARNGLVSTVESLGGAVLSESVSTSSVGPPATPMADAAIYPPMSGGPGVSIYAEVPATAFAQAVASLGTLGEVVQLTQSSYDVSASVADTDARVASLEASLARLRGLLAQAADLSQVIELENAISSRQAELDGLSAQQKALADQVQMSRLSVQLLTPDDADVYLGQTPGTWWDRFLAGLAQAWLWLGRALAVAVPLLVIGWLVVALVRRRRASARRSPTTGADS